MDTDTRIALKEGTLLRVYNKDGRAEAVYTIRDVLGRGRTGIVYNASYIDNAGCEHIVRIKECYPFHIDLTRDDAGRLIADEKDRMDFQECRKKLEESFRVNNELFHTDGLTNLISNTMNWYEANNTSYVISTYMQGSVLSCETAGTIKDCVSIVKSVAAAIQKMHEKGFLYLDIKPENILVLHGTAQMVQLFDFDALIPISEIGKPGGADRYRISYTVGFAALEQQRGLFRKLGKYTDVFGIGALLFYLLFGRTTEAPDCEIDAEYRFNQCRFAGQDYQDKLFQALPDFFHHTLASYWMDRYQDMEQVIRKLEEIEKYADTVVPFLISSQIDRPPVLVGREKELEALDSWMGQKESNSLFLTGMGGIGKSALVRVYLADNRHRFDAMLYLYYNGDIKRMIADDGQLRINVITRREEESTAEYFSRKMKMLRDLTVEKKVVLVVDDFDGELDQDFAALLNVNWKVIVVTRKKMTETSFRTLRLTAIAERENLYALFERYARREMDETELGYVDDIICKVAGHTLALQLIARQIECSHISVAEASALLAEKGFAHMAPEKVDYVKDQVLYYETISGIIDALFQAEGVTQVKKMLLKALSLIPAPGLEMDFFAKTMVLDSKDEINELIKGGWVELEGKRLSIHPVVREAIRRWEWDWECQSGFARLAFSIYFKIALESKREEHPLEIAEGLKKAREVMKESDEARKRLGDNVTQKGYEGEILLWQFMEYDSRETTDYQKLHYWLHMAEEVLESCQGETVLQKMNEYGNLLYHTIMNMPSDREEYVLEHAGELLDGLEEKELAIKGNSAMDLYDRVITIYQRRNDLDSAYAQLKKAEKIARRSEDNYVRGLYYMILEGYCDAVVDSRYGFKEMAKDIRKVLWATDKALHYLKKVKSDDSMAPYAKKLLAKALLSKAHVFICSYPEKHREINSLLDKVKEILEEHIGQYSRISLEYRVVVGWYYTYIEENYRLMTFFMLAAEEVSRATAETDLDSIENLLVPWYSMLMDLGEYEEAAEKAIVGILMCEKEEYKGVIPYIREKMYLYACLLDAYYLNKDFGKCREIITEIDAENEANREYGVVKVIAADYREEIFSRE